MKKLILLILLIPSILFAGPLQQAHKKVIAGSTVVVTSLCDGTNLFCCGWETGTNETNTNATGNEDVWDSVTGTIARQSYDFELDYGIKTAQASSTYLTSDNAGSTWDQDTIYVRAEFEVDTEAANTGSVNAIIQLRDTQQSAVCEIYLVDDASNYDNVIEVGCRSDTVDTSATTIGTNQTIDLDTKYQVILKFSNSVDDGEVAWWLYNESGTQIYSSGATTVTVSTAVDTVHIGSISQNMAITFDAVIIDDTNPGTY